MGLPFVGLGDALVFDGAVVVFAKHPEFDFFGGPRGGIEANGDVDETEAYRTLPDRSHLRTCMWAWGGATGLFS
jgi:hypothetical protein